MSDDLANALRDLLDWAGEHTSPLDANSPHHLLVSGHAALRRHTEARARLNVARDQEINEVLSEPRPMSMAVTPWVPTIAQDTSLGFYFLDEDLVFLDEIETPEHIQRAKLRIEQKRAAAHLMLSGKWPLPKE
jgi:hypothetical protein